MKKIGKLLLTKRSVSFFFLLGIIITYFIYASENESVHNLYTTILGFILSNIAQNRTSIALVAITLVFILGNSFKNPILAFPRKLAKKPIASFLIYSPLVSTTLTLCFGAGVMVYAAIAEPLNALPYSLMALYLAFLGLILRVPLVKAPEIYRYFRK